MTLLLIATVGVPPITTTAAAAGPAGMAGSGTADDPYVITDATQLQAMEQDLDAYYVLGGDIDASGTTGWHSNQGFDPVGDGAGSFIGTFDGRDHTITGLVIDRGSEDYVGLFGILGSGSTVSNVTLVEANVTGGDNTGTLVGDNHGTITTSGSTGTVAGTDRTGGLVGNNDGTVSESYATTDVVDATNYGGGGLVGFNHGLVEESYARGNVTSDDNAGGLIGTAWYDGTVRDSYATGSVSGSSRAAGVIGRNEDSTTVDLYWDEESTGQSDGATRYGGDFTGLTTDELTGPAVAANLTGLDFGGTWAETNGYPVLRWQVESLSLSLAETTVVKELSTNATVTVTLDDGSTAMATGAATYATTDASIATVSPAGRVDAVAVGTVAISATHAGHSEAVSLDVVETANDGWWTHRATLGRTGYTPTASGPSASPETVWTFNFTYNSSDPDEYMSIAYATKNPAVVDGTVYFTSGNGRVYAVDVATGEQEWLFETKGMFWSSPTVSNGTLYVADYPRYDSETETYEGGNLYAIDAETGVEQWRYDIDAEDTRDEKYSDYGAYDSFPVSNGTVFFGDENGTVHAVDAESGTKEWTYDAWRDADDRWSSFDYGPAIANGTLYISDNAGQLYALDTANGEQEWRVENDRNRNNQGLAVGNGTVYIGGYDAGYQLEAYDAATGTLEWTAPFSGEYEILAGSPAYANGTVYVATSAGNLTAYDGDTGSLLWTHDSTPEGYSYARYDYGPIVADGTVYANHHSWNPGGYVHAVDADTGTEQWEYNVSTKYLYTTPTVWNGRVYVGGQHYERTDSGYRFEGRLHAIGSTVTLSVVNTSAPVTETESVTINASVTNNREAATTETVRLLDATGTVVDSTSVSFAAGETTVVPLTWESALGDDGNNELTIEVVDAAREPTTVPVLADQPPTARAGGNVTAGTGNEIGFDATKSTDVAGIASYDWNFGDGTTATGRTPTHEFTTDGNYTVTLTVTDTVGQTDSDTTGVRVVDDSLLVADPGTNYTVDEDAALKFNGTDSTASAGIAAYAWDFDANGTTDATGPTPTHTFTELGSYPVTLTVTDSVGNSVGTTTVVEVRDATDPVPDAGANRTVQERARVQFDGTASTDNVEVARYDWDFDGDGTFDASGPRPTYTYTEHGNFTAILEVTDEAGNSATDEADIQVTEFVVPSVTVRIDRTDAPVVEGENLTVNITARNIGDASTTQTIRLADATGTIHDEADVTLPSNDGKSIALSWPTTPGDDGRVEIAVKSANDTATEQVTIQRRAEFELTVAESNSPIKEGETLIVNATIENVGDIAGTQTIELRDFDGVVVDSTTVTLDGRTSQTVPLTWETEQGEAGTNSISVSSENDTANTVIRIQELSPAKFTTAIKSTTSPVTVNEALAVSMNVTNVGDLDGMKPVNLSVDGRLVNDTIVSVAGGNNTTVVLAWTPSGADVGTRSITAESDGSSDSTSVSIVDETDPVAEAGSNRSVPEDSSIEFNGSNSTDNGKIQKYDWAFGDGSANATGTTPNHTFADPGIYTVTLVVTDTGGNVDSDTLLLTVNDTTPPQAPSTPNLVTASDSGRSNTDNVTNETTPTVTGSAEANATITVLSNSDGELGTTTANGDGDWSFTPGSALAETTHEITVTATDAAGNTGPASNALTVIIDTTPPSLPSTPDLEAASDTGKSNADDLTNETVPTLSGTAEADATLMVVSDQDGVLGTTTADANGNWSLTSDSALTAMTHEITVTATDAAGNTGPTTNALTVTIDTTAPAPPSTPDLAPGSDTGRSSTDNLTNDTTPSLSGTAEADATVIVTSDQDGVLGTTTVDVNGNWSFTPGSALSAETHSLTAMASDDAGNTGPASGALTVTVDTSAPSTPAMPDLTAGSDTGASSTDNVTNETRPTLTGTAATNAVVTITSDQDGVLGTTTANGDGDWSFTPATALSEAIHSLTATATDVTGNEGDPSSALTIEVDTSEPPTPETPNLTATSDSGASNSDDLTNDTTPTITGTAVANATVVITSDQDGQLGTTTANGDGDWSFTPSALSETTHAISVTATDAAGNTGSDSSALSMTIDTTAPRDPAAPDLTAASDSGASNTDDLTNDTTPTMDGTAEANATVEVTSDLDGSLGTAIADPDGNWSFTPTTELSDGDHVITVNATDAAGNTGQDSDGLTITIDTAAPAAPATPVLPASSDSGASRTDDVTNATMPTLSGTAEANAVVTLVSDQDGQLGTTIADGDGNWTFTPGATLSDGTHSLSVTAKDTAGNTGATSSGLNVTIDTSAPSAPSTPDLDAASDTGRSSSDDLTGDATPTLSGTAEAGATVTITSDQDGTLGTTTADGTGTWTFTPGAEVSEATHSLTAVATDAAGNTGPASDSLSLTVDTSAPAAPSTPDLNATTDSGRSNTDDLTNETQPTLSGTAEANAVIIVTSDEIGTLGTTTADRNGNWSFTPGSALSAGTNSFTASATDAAGNTGPDSAGLTITVDTAAPMPPAAPDLVPGSDSGSSQTDNVTNKTNLEFTGTAEANAVVTIVSNQHGTLGTTTADGAGVWSFTTGFALPAGTHALTATATDIAGNTGPASTALTVTIDTAAPEAPSAPDLEAVSDSGSSSTDNVTNETRPTLTGKAAAYALVTVLSDQNGALGTTTADRAGDWSYTPSTALPEGPATLTATATDAAGNTGPASAELAITIDTTAPGAPSAPDLAAVNDSGASTTDDVTNETTPTFSGTAEPNATVTVSSDRDGTLGTTTADQNGTWTFTPRSALSDGTHSLSVTATDTAGTTSPTSGMLTVTIDTAIPVAAAGGNRTVDEDTDIIFNGSNSTDNDRVSSFEWVFGDGANETGASTNHTFGDPGTHTVTLTVTDAAGNRGTDSFVLTVTDTTSPTAAAGNDTAVRFGESVAFSAIDSTDNVGITAFEWTFGDGANETGANATHTFSRSGTFTVTLTVTDAAGNQGTDVRNVTVRPQPSPPTASSPSDESNGETSVVVTPRNNSSGVALNVSVTNVEAEQPVVVDLNRSRNTTGDDGSGDIARENVSMSRLTVNVSNSEDFTLDVRTYDATENETANERFLQETGASSAGYVVVNHSVSDDRIMNVTFTFEVRKTYLERRGITVDSVALYRNETERWRTLDTALVDETDTHYVFEATSPGLSVFVIGSTVPVFEPSAANLSAETVTVGEELTVTVAVDNRGGAAGSFTAELLVDGEPVATNSVTVDAFEEATLALDHSFDAPGTYELAVGDHVIGAVTVNAATTTTATTTTVATTEQPTESDKDTSGSTSRILVVVIVVAVAGGALLWYRRRS